jgi:hypothetical protein
MRKKKEMKRTTGVDDLNSVRQLLRKLTAEVDDVDEFANTRIHLIAQSKVYRPIKLNQLRTTIETRLRNFPYPYPEERDHEGRTFFQWLQSRGALEILLSEDVLKDIRNALHLVAIAEADFLYEQRGRNGYGFPVKFHRGILRELLRHQGQIEKLRGQYEVPDGWTENYEAQIGRQEIKELRAIGSSRWPGDRKLIMGSGWSFELAAAIRVYDVLYKRLKPKLSARCLQMLAPIISAGDHKRPITYHALRNALDRRK